MASGSIMLDPSSSGTDWYGYISYNQEQISGTNVSKVTVAVYTVRDWNPAPGTFSGVVTINGAQSVFSYSGEPASQDTFRHSFETQIANDPSGVTSVTFSCTISCQSGELAGYSLDGMETVQFSTSTVHPASSIDIIAGSPRQMGKELGITIRNADSSTNAFVHNVYYSFGAAQHREFLMGVGKGSYRQVVPDLAAYCNDATNGTLSLQVDTYLDGAYVGSTTTSVVISVPDATVPAVAGNTFVMGTGKTITTARGSTNFTIQLFCGFNAEYVTIGEAKSDSFTWNPSYNLAKQITGSVSGAGTLVCYTYNGTALVGQHNLTVSISVPDNDTTKPNITKVETALISSLPSQFAGMYVKGKTGVKVTVTASSTYSTLASYGAKAGSDQATSTTKDVTIKTVTGAGSLAVTGTATDARGYSRTVSGGNITVQDYSKPQLTAVSGYGKVICARADNSGVASDSGNRVLVRANRTFSSVSGKNTCTIQYRYAKDTASPQFNSWTSLGTSHNGLIPNLTIDVATVFIFQLRAIDLIGEEYVLEFKISTEGVSFSLAKARKGAAFGMIATERDEVGISNDMLLKAYGNAQVDGTLTINGNLKCEGDGWQPLTLESGIRAGNPAYVGRYNGAAYRISEGHHVYIAFNVGFDWTGDPVLISKVPNAINSGARLVYASCQSSGLTALVQLHGAGLYVVGVEDGRWPVTWIDGYIDYWI